MQLAAQYVLKAPDQLEHREIELIGIDLSRQADCFRPPHAVCQVELDELGVALRDLLGKHRKTRERALVRRSGARRRRLPGGTRGFAGVIGASFVARES